MSEPSAIEVKRTTQVVDVMALIFADPSITVEKACDAIGITTSTYYAWVQKAPESLRVVKDFLADVQRRELAYLSAAVSNINIALAKKALVDDTETADRLRIAKYLSAEAEKLQRIYQVNSGGEDAADFLRDGPQVRTKQSRFASINVSPDGEGVNVEIFKEDDVIDGELLDEPESS